MAETVSCGGVVIHKGRVLVLYKNQSRKYTGWVLPKGTVEGKENLRQTAVREVREEAKVFAKILKYLGNTQYTFRGAAETVDKTVHWYLMSAGSHYCSPQHEEYFSDAGFYKKHEAYHLLKFQDEKQIILRAYDEYEILRRKAESNKAIRRNNN
ncbi:MAG: NUDIX domain-containing protein [Defluviitaleaceae bacterium]|nr:NUDIX domain-containing protein [Defluviitaleaceae bacterium]